MATLPRNLQRCRSLGPILDLAVSAGGWRPYSEAPQPEHLARPRRSSRARPSAAQVSAPKAQRAVGPSRTRPRPSAAVFERRRRQEKASQPRGAAGPRESNRRAGSGRGQVPPLLLRGQTCASLGGERRWCPCNARSPAPKPGWEGPSASLITPGLVSG